MSTLSFGFSQAEASVFRIALMVPEKWRWWTAVLLLIIVTGAAGCGGASNDTGGAASATTSQGSQSEPPATVKKPEPSSKNALIEDLRAAGYSKADATFAANNRSALEAALIYYGSRAHSKDAMIRGLTRVEKFTPAQARDAASKLYDSGGIASQTTPQDSQSEQPAAEKQPARTAGQKQALAKAQTLVDSGPPSKDRLIVLLRAAGYSKADATFAANNVEVDWNQEAFQRGASFLADVQPPLSKDAVFWLLTLLEQFTPGQARYAVNKLY